MPDAREPSDTCEPDSDAVEVGLAEADETTSEDDDGRERVVDVWTCNLLAVRVFQHCTITGISAGLGGIWWTGIAAEEISVVCRLLNVPASQQADVTWDVRYMGKCVADARNQRAAEAARRREHSR